MNEMFNAATSLFPLMAMKEDNGLYINISLFAFSIIATINHMFPENLAGTTHIVKLLVSNILFSLLGIDPAIGFTISLLDVSPLFFKSKILHILGELLVQIPRQLIDLYFIYYIVAEKQYYERAAFIVISKGIYFLERRLRIKREERNNFYFLHCFEHAGFYVLVCSLVNADVLNIVLYLKIFISFMVFWSVMIYSYTYYLTKNHLSRAPAWLKETPGLVDILKNKLEKNLHSGKFHNYICKPWTYHLKMEVVTWTRVEKMCEELAKRIDKKEFDAVVGISTGGAFIGAYMAKLLDKPSFVVHSKLWSGTNFLENSRKALGFFMGKDINPDITGIPAVAGMRILLCDDTTYTGVTMNKCKKYMEETCKATEVKTLNFWIHERFIPDYYLKRKRVPIFWEWGAEMD